MHRPAAALRLPPSSRLNAMLGPIDHNKLDALNKFPKLLLL
jgi:hypothetical protein